MSDAFRHVPPAIAQDHLSHRYAVGLDRSSWEGGIPLEPVEALGQLCRAERGERDTRWGNAWELPVPRKVEVAAGLSLLAEIRADLERQELLLINGARSRGLTWEQIADVLGLDSRQAAEQRCRRLRERWPEDAPPRELPAEAAAEGEICIPPAGHLRAGVPADPVP